MSTDPKAPITEADFAGHEFLTAAETICLLRLDHDGRNALWRLRNLMRFQQLPFLRRGKLLLFRRSAVERWLENPPKPTPMRARAMRQAKRASKKGRAGTTGSGSAGIASVADLKDDGRLSIVTPEAEDKRKSISQLPQSERNRGQGVQSDQPV